MPLAGSVGTGSFVMVFRRRFFFEMVGVLTAQRDRLWYELGIASGGHRCGDSCGCGAFPWKPAQSISLLPSSNSSFFYSYITGASNKVARSPTISRSQPCTRQIRLLDRFPRHIGLNPLHSSHITQVLANQLFTYRYSSATCETEEQQAL